MRIAIVTYQGYDGAGVLHAHEFANYMCKRGHEVLFLLTGSPETAELLADPPKYHLEPVQFYGGVLSHKNVRVIEKFRPEILHLWTPRHLPARVALEAWNLTECQVLIHYEDDEEYILKHIGTNCRFGEDDLEICEFFREPECDSKILDQLVSTLDIEFIRHTISEPLSWRWSHPLISPIVEKLASAFTSISPTYQRRLRRRWGKPIRILYPGVDLERFSPRERPRGLEEELGLRGRIVLLYSGSIAKFHDFISVLEAFSRLADLYPETVLVQVGYNYVSEITSRIVQENGIEERAIFTGPVPHHKMVDYLALADVFVGSVRRDQFNAHRLPSKIPEYMAMGRPLLVMDHGFSHELDDELEVIKVRDDSVQGIAVGLKSILEKKKSWPRMGERLRSKARHLFDWQRNTDFLLSFYEEVLEEVELEEVGESNAEGLSISGKSPTIREIGYMIEAEEVSSAGSLLEKKKFLIITEGLIGSKMSGTGIRYLEIARHLAEIEHLDVALGCRSQEEPGLVYKGLDLDIFVWNFDSPEVVVGRSEDADFILTHGFMIEKIPQLRDVKGKLIVDLYCPFIFENIEIHRDRATPLEERQGIHENDLRVLLEQLRVGDYFLCCTERQRDWALGMLTALGRLHPGNCTRNTSPEDFVALVPFGFPEAAPPPSEGKVMKGVWPGIDLDDFVLLWGGGIWSWLDPLTVIRAMGKVARVRSDIKLVFLSTITADSVISMPVMQEVIALAEDLGLKGQSVIFNDRFYVDYTDRCDYFNEADFGVCAQRNTMETYFAYRTRILDCLNVGLPILTSEGDYLGDFVEERKLGRSLPINDSGAWATAILTLANDASLRDEYRRNIEKIRSEFTWKGAVVPLVSYSLRDFGKGIGLVDRSSQADSAAERSERVTSLEWLARSSPEEIFEAAVEQVGILRQDYEEASVYAWKLEKELGELGATYGTLETYARKLEEELELVKAAREEADRERSRKILDMQRQYSSLEDSHADLKTKAANLQQKVDLLKKIPFAEKIWRLSSKSRSSGPE